jgi:nicotinic acid mononucleotide adenylyltransferase
MQYTVLIPGGFKPPHKGHYDYIKSYLDNPEVEKVILFCGDKERDGITLEHTEKILEIYGLLSHPKMDYRRAIVREGKKKNYTNPLADCFDWGDENTYSRFGLACSEKDAGYQVSFGDYFYGNDNYTLVPVFKMNDRLSATDFRLALRNGDSISKFLPDGVSEEEVRQLFKA